MPLTVRFNPISFKEPGSTLIPRLKLFCFAPSNEEKKACNLVYHFHPFPLGNVEHCTAKLMF